VNSGTTRGFPEVAVVGFAQSPQVAETSGTTNGVEMLVPVFRELYAATGLTRRDIGFWCSGSSDYLAGRSFSFVSAVDAIGALPPIMESHVESDAAWALYEAWVKIRTGEVETALVYGFGKASAGELHRVLTMQLDPYLMAPLWPDAVSLAALQARAGIEAGAWSEKEMAEVAANRRTSGATNPNAQLREPLNPGTLLDAPYLADPLRAHDCAPVTDGAAAIVLAAGHRADELCRRPAWITGLAHRVDSPALGARDLTRAPSAGQAAADAGATGGGIEVAELAAPFTSQELLLRRELKLGEDVTVNPSGGPLCGNPMFAGGLVRIGEAAARVMDGSAGRVLGHASNGPLLQQNLICVLEGR
jgi:acetyl-CoA acetyltransferase